MYWPNDFKFISKSKISSRIDIYNKNWMLLLKILKLIVYFNAKTALYDFFFYINLKKTRFLDELYFIFLFAVIFWLKSNFLFLVWPAVTLLIFVAPYQIRCSYYKCKKSTFFVWRIVYKKKIAELLIIIF